MLILPGSSIEREQKTTGKRFDLRDIPAIVCEFIAPKTTKKQRPRPLWVFLK